MLSKYSQTSDEMGLTAQALQISHSSAADSSFEARASKLHPRSRTTVKRSASIKRFMRGPPYAGSSEPHGLLLMVLQLCSGVALCFQGPKSRSGKGRPPRTLYIVA